ncbi:MAG: hypothetical protein KDD33_10680 [Bdellovibrionales bacterium]|nr:hypothetical protein [Bdellovibrionales bacterium]
MRFFIFISVSVSFLFILGCQAKPTQNHSQDKKTMGKDQGNRSPQSLGNFSETTGSDFGDENTVAESGILPNCFDSESPYFASNQELSMNGKLYPADTQFSIYKSNEGYQVLAHLKDGSGSEKDDEGTYDSFELPLNQLSCSQFTSIPVTEDENGDVVLGEYSLPIDYKLAGKKKKPRRRKGTTYCYREVKRVVRRKITLTGRSAYMANAQLKRAGWRRYSSYKAAPNGSICVFGRGGKVTSSGGHKHGHIGIKGRGGVINPLSGFKLKRPFLGCYYK